MVAREIHCDTQCSGRKSVPVVPQKTHVSVKALPSMSMEDKVQQPASDEPKQVTEKGVEIPVPKRRDLMDAFRKIVQPIKKS
jgi:hypothetical protein